MPVDKRAAALAGIGALGAAVVVSYALSAKKPQLTPITLVQVPPNLPPITLPPANTQASTLPDKTPFPFDRLQTMLVPPKSSATVFLGQIPSAYAAIITDVGNTFPVAVTSKGTSLFTLNWMVDGDLVERVQRIISDINSPKRLNPAILATDEIRWVGVNQHPTDAALVSVVQDGFLQKRVDR